MALSERKLELVWDGKDILGEGPVWDHRSGRLLWVDIYGKRVHWLNPEQGVQRTVRLPQMVGSAVPAEHGGVVLALEEGFYLLNVETERIIKLAAPEPGKPGNRFNDGKCDAAGRFWAGTMDREEVKPVGALYALEPDGSVRKAVEGVTVSNGLAWSADNSMMYYIDSPTKSVVAYHFDLEAGVLTNPRKIIVIPEGEGFPDGMTIDNEGMLWIAQWDGWQVSRWDPTTGVKLDSIPVPAARVTSCVFGGESFDELYITTARTGQTEEQLAKQPNAGGVFRIKPGVKGMPAQFYGG